MCAYGVQATPSADTAMFYFYTNSLGFDAEFMGRIRLLGRYGVALAVHSSGCSFGTSSRVCCQCSKQAACW